MQAVFSRRAFLSVGVAVGASTALSCPSIAQDMPQRHLARAFPSAPKGRTPDTIRDVATTEPVIALTFDDGPHQTLTSQILDILAARQIKASFFVVGNRVAQAPDIVARIAQDGHEIGNHSWSHPRLGVMEDHDILDQIDRTAHAVAAVTGHSPVLMRPPYGDFNARRSQMLRAARDLPTILWSVDPQDWRRPGGMAIAEHMIAHARPGAVILAHDTVSQTLRNLPLALDTLLARGYRFVTVSALIGWPEWTDRRNARGHAFG